MAGLPLTLHVYFNKLPGLHGNSKFSSIRAIVASLPSHFRLEVRYTLRIPNLCKGELWSSLLKNFSSDIEDFDKVKLFITSITLA